MKRIILITSILLFAAGCSKSQPVVQTAPSQSQPTQTQQATSTLATTTSSPSAIPPLIMSVYKNTAGNYLVRYLSYFTLATPANIKANNLKGLNLSACVPYGIMPNVCFVLKDQPYANTNLVSAAVGISVLPGKNIGECGNFTPQDLQGGKVGSPVQINNIVFIIASSTDAGAGNFSETHFNRAFYNTTCYEITQSVRWADAGNFSPPRAEFDRNDVWAKLDVLRNGFGYIKQ